MTFASSSYPRLFQVSLLVAFVIAAAGFVLPSTVHALPPTEVVVGDGGEGDGGGPTISAASLTATPSSVQQGYASQLSYSSSGVTSCSINNGVGAVVANASGYRSVSPASTTTYTITCQTSLGDTVTDTVTVTVTAAPTPLVAYCDAGPETAQIDETVLWSASASGGNSTSLTWRAGTSFVTKVCSGGQNYMSLNRDCPEDIHQGASCSVEGARCRSSMGCDGQEFVDGEEQNNAHAYYGSVMPYTCVASGSSAATYTYAWTGTDSLSGSVQTVSKAYATAGEKTGRATVTRSTGGSASATCTATIVPKTPTATLTANPPSVLSGAPSTLTWSSTNASACTLNEGIGSVSTSGTSAVTPGSTTTYTLMCTAPATATGGTWQYYDSDISDFSCPVTDTNKAYSSVPNCPANPQGKACTNGAGMTICKQNTVSGCNILTDIYQCAGSSSSPAQSANASATVTVTASADLTAGSITPTSATAGTAQTFSATVSNIGAGNAGASATRFQRATSAAGAGAATISDASTAAILAAGNLVTSAAYTFPSAGTYYVRACADTGLAVAEANEGNNCGAWTAVTVSAASAPTVSCTVSPASVLPGGSVTYRATPSGGAGAPYTWTSSDNGSFGSGTTVNRTFDTAGTYAMNVDTPTTPVAYCPNVSVAANWCTAGAPTLSITATPSRVRAGQSSALTWSATGVNGQAASCTVSGPGVSWNSAVTLAPSCSASGSANTTISTQSTYTLSCDGGVSETVTVNVIPGIIEF